MIANFSSWWELLSLMGKIYWSVAIPFTLIFIIQLILSFIGADGGHDMSGSDADAAVDHDHGLGFQFFTLKNLTGFFALFGWSGLACLNAGLGNIPTVIISFVCGLVMMTVMAAIFYYMSRLTESGNMDINNAIGKLATVYLTIPAQRKGNGKVHVRVQNTLRELDATTDALQDIKTGSMVEVTDVLNDNVLLVKLK